MSAAPKPKRNPAPPALPHIREPDDQWIIEEFGEDAYRKLQAERAAWEDQHLKGQEGIHRKLFPGDPERARALGRLYEAVNVWLTANVFAAPNADRYQLIRALQKLLGGQLRARRPPRKAPALWAKRKDTTLSPAVFTRQTYGDWIGAGLTRRHLKELDPQLYQALSVWEHRHPEDRIDELPTQSEAIDQIIDVLGAEFSEDELRRIGTTLQTRLRRENSV